MTKNLCFQLPVNTSNAYLTIKQTQFRLQKRNPTSMGCPNDWLKIRQLSTTINDPDDAGSVQGQVKDGSSMTWKLPSSACFFFPCR